MPSFPNLNKQLILILLALIALAAAGMALYATAQGPVGFSDSAAYLSAGRNWARGEGLGVYQASGDFEPLSVHPPLYAAFYSLLHLLGIDLVAGGRWMSVAAAALAPLALGLIFVRHSHAPWLGLPIAAIYAIFPPILLVNAALLTDAIFLAVFLWGLLALLEYRQSRSQAWAVAAILLFGALPLIRLIGAAPLGAAVLFLLLWGHGDGRQRWQRAALFGALAALPYILWQIVSYFTLDATLAGRQLNLSPRDLLPALLEATTKMASILYAWFPFLPSLSDASPWPFVIALAALFLALGLWVARRTRDAADWDEGILFAAFVLNGLALLGGVLIAYLFARPTPDIIDRTLLPLFVCGIGTLLAAAAVGLRAAPRVSLALTLLLSALFVFTYARPAYVQTVALHRGQGGYFTDEWRDSELLAYLRDLPHDTAIIASEPGITLYWADRPSYGFFHAQRPGFIGSGAAYGSDTVDDAQVAFSQGDAVLVLFDGFPEGLVDRLADSGTLTSARLLAEYDQGQIYAPIEETP